MRSLFLWLFWGKFGPIFEMFLHVLRNSKSSNGTVCSCHVTYAFQSESTLYSCLNVKEFLARSWRQIWSLSECNWTRTQKHLVRKWTLNHLAKLTKWLTCVLSTYLYGTFDCMFSSCQVRISDWIHTLYLRECQGSPCSKQARNVKFKWLELNSNPKRLSS